MSDVYLTSKSKRRLSSDVLFLPEEIAQEIFLRLPVDSLMRCTAVCESWRSFIKSSNFIRKGLHRQSSHHNAGARQLLLLQVSEPVKDNRRHCTLQWDWEDGKIFTECISLKEPHARTLHIKQVDVIGTCNGLVCLVDRHNGYTTLIWNPYIRKYVVLPRPSITLFQDVEHDVKHAFAYDSRADDYKVFASLSHNSRNERSCKVAIWSLAKNSWKSLGPDAIHPEFGSFSLYNSPAFVNGALHWVQVRKNKDYFIASFDVSSERFGEIMVPEDLRKKRYNTHPITTCHVTMYEECSLALFEIGKTTEDYTVCFEMWVMKDYGVTESWTKLYTVWLPCSYYEIAKPVGFRKNGQLVIRTRGTSISVDLKSNQVHDFYIKKDERYHLVFMDSFVPSLVLLGHRNATAY